MPVTLNTLVLAMEAEEAGLATPGWYLEDLGDWDIIPDSKSEMRERAQADGAHDIAQDFYKSLPFSIKGNFLGSSRADVQAAKTTLKTTLGRGAMVPVIVADVDGPRQRMVSIRHLAFTNDRAGGREIGFTVDCIATDPKMYGPVQLIPTGVPTSGGGLTWPLGTAASGKFWDWGADSASGAVSVTNLGNAWSVPDLMAYGGMSGGFTATDVTLGQTVRLDRLIPPNSVATIRQRTERAFIDVPSNDVSGQLTGTDFFAIGPGETHIIKFAPLGALSGTPSFAISAASAYI